MKKLLPTFLSVSMTMALASCAPETTPTLSSIDLADTAVAFAWTEVGLTHTAFPSATVAPPTATPPPSPAPVASLAPIATVGPPASETPDPCNLPPPVPVQGQRVQVTFVNKSGGSMNLGLGMIQPNALGECGTYNFSIGVFESPTVQILAGCYWGFAWISGIKSSTAQTIANLCMQDSSIAWQIIIGTEVIELK